MPLLVNLRHLEAHNILLEGTLPIEELDIDSRDEVIQASHPLDYDLEVQKLDDSLLVQGKLGLVLECQCVRCLKAFQYRLELSRWTCHLPLKGEEAAPVVSDCVDLTPYVREDILLEFPRHPLCDPECSGLPGTAVGKSKNTSDAGETKAGSPAWAELNKLKL
jgi:uncharacterized protein